MSIQCQSGVYPLKLGKYNRTVLINNTACIAEIELFDDQVLLLEFLQSITDGAWRKMGFCHNVLVRHFTTGPEYLQDFF